MGIFKGAYNNLTEMSNTLNDMGATLDRQKIRSDTKAARNTLRQIQLNQEIEEARKRGDKEAEQKAILEKQNLQKSAEIDKKVDSAINFIAALPVILVLGLIVYLFIL